MKVSPEVKLDHVFKRYGSVPVLRDVTMTVPAGSFTVLLGPSGSGKSTLLRCVAGIEQISDGSISIGGQVVAAKRRHCPPERRELAMVFQDYALWPHMKVSANVAFALRRLDLSGTEVHARVGNMLERLGLDGLADRYPAELSGGQQQRVALARALVSRPGLILFDEPLSNLDADLRDRLRVEIATLVREAGSTALYITHDQAEAFALADLVGVVHEGQLVQLGPAEEIYSAPKTPFVARFTGLSGELPAKISARPDNGMVRASIGDAHFSARCHALGDRVDPRASVTVMVRHGTVHIAPPGSAEETLEAEVIDAAFRGRGYDHVIQLTTGQRMVGVFDKRRHNPGDRVRIRLDPAGCHAYFTPSGNEAGDSGASRSAESGTPRPEEAAAWPAA